MGMARKSMHIGPPGMEIAVIVDYIKRQIYLVFVEPAVGIEPTTY
jgi:hypothetical protein